MEKIYMEENKSQRQGRQKLDISVLLSFVIAIFAIFSIATYGIVSLQGNGVSYALTPTPNSFTFTFGTDNTGEKEVQIRSNGGSGFSVPLYLANNSFDTPIFCVEHNSDVPNDQKDPNAAYEKDGDISDYGLLYLLNNSYANGKKQTNVEGTNGKYVEAWITQVAIWMYLYETDTNATKSDSRNYISPEDVEKIKAATSLSFTEDYVSDTPIFTPGGNIYETYVKPLVDAAKKASNTKVLTVSKASGEISKTSDGKYYQSTLISVLGNPPEDLTSYDISVSGIDGAIVVGEDGKELSLTGVTPGKNFYVRIPKEKVTEQVQTLRVTVTGHFNTLTGSYFISKQKPTLQKVVSVTGATKNVSEGTSIEFVGAPDTGMNTAQTIYFIGLIVLLCGVGIVYANAKPVESKQ